MESVVNTWVCEEKDGWEGIETALSQASSGDIVRICPGRFAGKSVLNIPSGVALEGTQDSRLVHSGAGPAIQIVDGKNVKIAGFQLTSEAQSGRKRVLPENNPISDEDEQPVEWGLVWVNNSRQVSLRNLVVAGHTQDGWLRGICARFSSKVSVDSCQVSNLAGSAISLISATECNVSNCSVSKAANGIVLFRSRDNGPASSAVLNSNLCHENKQSGIVLYSSESTGIEGNECWGSIFGISLQRDVNRPDACSSAPVTGNKCHDNMASGIALLSSNSAGIEGNECWENDVSGIVLARGMVSPGASSYAPVTGNKCHDNKDSGIALLSSDSSSIEGNECWGNGRSGIMLERAALIPDEPSSAPVAGNKCHDNKEVGISLRSSESPSIEGNECWGNDRHGIILTRDEKSPDAPSCAPVTGNKCHDNKMSGILLLSSESAGIEGNECWGNDRHGIVLERDERSPDAPSSAPVIANKCYDNNETGILLFSSESAGIEGNECWGNDRHGIVLERDERSPDAPSCAPVTGNKCHDNKMSGILLLSSESAGIEGNECWGNDRHGIVLERDERSPDAPSSAPVIANKCYDNNETGILLFSSESAGIEGNECWGNDRHGIVLERDEGSPDAPSSAPVIANKCYDNNETGILLLSSESAGIEGNECWGNDRHGIVLERDERSPDAPSCAPVTGNKCHDNKMSGILLLSSESAGIEGNECWGNDRHGIVLERDERSPDAPSSAPVIANKCHDNKMSGIALYSSESMGIERNECQRNDSSGIILGRHEWTPEAPSSAPIIKNRCHANKEGGILLLSSDSARIKGNECWGNGVAGIALQRSNNSLEVSSRAPVTGNKCHNNNSTGILLSSSDSPGIEGNECWKNGVAGILLGRNDEGLGGPSSAPIVNNKCYDNKHSGILLNSSSSTGIDGNECWGSDLFGIVLLRDETSPEAPSHALVTDNKCHDNKLSGIALYSSESTGIIGNECWGNAAGVALDRGEASPQAPSSAPIINNRCHDNKGVGIALVSSDSARIEGNECWGNYFFGIVLDRAENNPEAPSCAPLKGNKCHDNKEAGIALFSSNSADIEGNECWGNDRVGIILARGSSNPDAPSNANIKGNRCHDNHTGFSATIGSGISQGGNFAFRNEEPSVLTATDGTTLHPLDWELLDPNETRSETLNRLRESEASGALATQLLGDGVERPDTLARYVTGSGCLECLKTWYDCEASLPQIEPQLQAEPGRVFRASKSVTGPLPTFDLVKGVSFFDAVWDNVKHHVFSGRHGCYIACAAGSENGDIDQIVHDAGIVNGFDMDAAVVNTHIPTGSDELLRFLQIKNISIGTPIINDYGLRSEMAFNEEQPETAFLEPDRPVGWSLAGQRLSNILRSPLLLLKTLGTMIVAFLALAAIGFVRDFSGKPLDLWGAAQHAIFENVDDLQVLDYFALPGLLIAVLATLYAIVNRNLPNYLSFRRPAFLDKWMKSIDDEASIFYGKPWRRWVRRHLYSRGDVNLLILRNVQEWVEDDRKALQDAIALRPKNKSLIVIIETPTKANVDRALLYPFHSDKLGRIDLQNVEVFDLFLGEEPGGLSLGENEPVGNLPNLLGLNGEENELHCEQIYAGIRDASFSIADILPMLTIGSTHLAPFRLKRRADHTFQNFGPEFIAQLNEYACVYSADLDFQLNLGNDSETLQQNLEDARAASASLVYLKQSDRTANYHIFGRYLRRDDMARELSAVFNAQGPDYIDYILALICCGEFHALETLQSDLSLSGDVTKSLLRLNRALSSASFLMEEQKRLANENSDRLTPNELGRQQTRETMLSAKRDVVCSALSQLVVGDESETHCQLASQVFMTSLRLKKTLYDLGGSIVSENVEIHSPEWHFLNRIKTALDLFGIYDRDFAKEKLSYYLHAELSGLPEECADQLNELITGAYDKGKCLAEHLSNADQEGLTVILANHSEMLQDVAATVYVWLAQHAETSTQKNALANMMARHRKAGIEISAGAQNRGIGLRMCLPFKEVVNYFDRRETIQLLCEPPEALTVSLGMSEIAYGTFDKLRGTIKNRFRIEMRM